MPETAGPAPSYILRILKNIYNCFWTKKWYGHGRTGRHGSNAPAYYRYLVFELSREFSLVQMGSLLCTACENTHCVACSSLISAANTCLPGIGNGDKAAHLLSYKQHATGNECSLGPDPPGVWFTSLVAKVNYATYSRLQPIFR